MHTFFQLPLELMQLSDKEFWQQINDLDALSEEMDSGMGGFAITMTNGQGTTKIPFIRFKKTLPSDKS